MREELRFESSSGIDLEGFRSVHKILALSVSFLVAAALIVVPAIL